MLEKINLTDIQTQILEWFTDHIWTLGSGIQFAIILVALIVSVLLGRYLKPRFNDKINGLKIPYRFAQVLHNMTKLVTPFIALIIIFGGTQLTQIEALGLEIDINFSEVITKLLSAWIIIRIVVQLIENSFARNVMAYTIWGIAALSIFGILDETTALLDSIGMDVGDFRLSALSIIKGLFIIFIFLYAALFTAGLLERRLDGVRSLTPSSRVLISKIARVALVAFALLAGITSAGIDLSLLAVFSGALGLGVGFGLQKGISNLFSGMILLLDQSIKPGDIIEMDGTFGWVNHMGARYTEIVTRDNKSFLVPNEDFITQQVVNWSHDNTLVRVETKFGVHYDSDPHLVKQIAQEAASKPDRVVHDPAPVCHLVEFGDSSLNFVLRFWIKDAEKGVTNMRGAVMLALWDALKEHKIAIPYPHREVFVRKES